MKLDYEEVKVCSIEALVAWDQCLLKRALYLKPKRDIFAQYVREGIPRHKRGDVWIFLAEKNKLEGISDENKLTDTDIDVDIPYRELLNQLTSQQHAILVDLGNY